MPDIEKARRLRIARIAAGFAHASDAATALGVPYQTYASHENGHRDFNGEVVLLYSRRFKVRLEWLLTGRGEQNARFELPDDLEQKLQKKSEKTRRRLFLVWNSMVDAWPDDIKDEPSSLPGEPVEDDKPRRNKSGDTVHLTTKLDP